MNGIPINYLSRWLGHSSIQTTLIYLELVPDPTGEPGDGAVTDKTEPKTSGDRCKWRWEVRLWALQKRTEQ